MRTAKNLLFGSLLLLIGVLAMSAIAFAGPAFTLTNTTGEQLGNGPYTLGWQFEVENAINVNALGVFDDSLNGLVHSYLVGIWDSSGNLLASATVDSGTTDPLINQFRYMSISPVLLNPGTYNIGAVWLDGSDPMLFPGDAQNFTTAPNIMFVSTAYVAGSSLTDPTFYDGGTIPAYFGPNFNTSSAVPEPTSLLLLGTGLGGIALAAWRKKKV